MRVRSYHNLKTFFIAPILVLACKMVPGLPWWAFVVPVAMLGIVITLLKWKVSSFLIGFLGGFLVWFGGNLYFHIAFEGRILSKLGSTAELIILLASGLMGGLLTGLALYTGKSIVHNKKAELTL